MNYYVNYAWLLILHSMSRSKGLASHYILSSTYINILYMVQVIDFKILL